MPDLPHKSAAPLVYGSTRAIAAQATSSAAHIAPLPDEDDPLLAFAPYLHKAPRRNSITPDLQRRFVATLAATGIVKQAAKSVGKSLEALYKLRHRPGAEGFAAAWDAALDRGVQRLEDCALERAIQGTPTPIVSGGEILGHWDKPDNHLLRFLLQQRLPQRYAVRAQELGPGHPAYDELTRQLLDQVDAHRERMENQVLARAMAMHTYRRRRLYRQQQELGPGAPPIKDAWDGPIEDGMPQLRHWGTGYETETAQAQMFLDAMENEDAEVSAGRASASRGTTVRTKP